MCSYVFRNFPPLLLGLINLAGNNELELISEHQLYVVVTLLVPCWQTWESQESAFLSSSQVMKTTSLGTTLRTTEVS